MNDAAMEFYCDVLEGLVELWFLHRRISICVCLQNLAGGIKKGQSDTVVCYTM
jgi:hypothetical protein